MIRDKEKEPVYLKISLTVLRKYLRIALYRLKFILNRKVIR